MLRNVIFREILPADLQAIFEVRIATWHTDRGREELAKWGITPESVRKSLAHSHRGWLCEVDSRVVSFAMGNRENGEMWVIAVLKDYEGRGIGKGLPNNRHCQCSGKISKTTKHNLDRVFWN